MFTLLATKMKKIWLFILWLCALFFAWNFTNAKDYEYTNLDITANILIDGTIDVKENFTANFFVNKHWIIRDIPLNYSVWWKDFHIDVSNINVQWKNFTTNKNNGNIEIKIWDADRTVIWRQNYPISYSTYGLIRNFSWIWYAELYWNLVGNQFDTNINNVRAELILPKTYTWFTKDDFLITTDGRSKTIDGFEWSVNWNRWDKIIITYDKWLSAYQGITLAIKFHNNYFEFDHGRQAGLSGDSMNLDTDYVKILIILWLIISIPFSAFITSIVKIIKSIIRNWKSSSKINKKREEYEKKYPVIVQYDAPKWLNSAEVWLLLNRYAKTEDLLTLIYKWASKKYIQIDSVGSVIIPEFSLTKLKDLPWHCPEYEKNLFSDIFTVTKSVFKSWEELNSLYYKLEYATLDLEDFWLKMWWFSKDKSNSSIKIWCKDVLIFMIWLPMLLIPLFRFVFILLIVLIVPSFIFTWAWKLQETEKWAKLISRILWYKEFIRACDENKLRLFLKDDPTFFDKTLPYAVVFGLETELFNKITPIMQEMNIKSSRYSWDIWEISSITSTISLAWTYHSTKSSHSSYNSDSWWDSGSSFDSGWSSFSSGWGWGWWGGRSW